MNASVAQGFLFVLFSAAFYIFSLSLILDSVINMCLGVFLLGFIVWDSLCFPDLGGYFLSHVREV